MLHRCHAGPRPARRPRLGLGLQYDALPYGRFRADAAAATESGRRAAARLECALLADGVLASPGGSTIKLQRDRGLTTGLELKLFTMGHLTPHFTEHFTSN